MNLDILDSWNIREIKNLIYVYTHGREGLTNLQNTMSNNSLQCPDSGVRQNRGRGVGWGLILGAWYPQAVVGKPTNSSVL